MDNVDIFLHSSKWLSFVWWDIYEHKLFKAMSGGLLKTVFPAETATYTSIITILYITFMINLI